VPARLIENLPRLRVAAAPAENQSQGQVFVLAQVLEVGAQHLSKLLSGSFIARWRGGRGVQFVGRVA
jgi:hypothetical protein